LLGHNRAGFAEVMVKQYWVCTVTKPEKSF